MITKRLIGFIIFIFYLNPFLSRRYPNYEHNLSFRGPGIIFNDKKELNNYDHFGNVLLDEKLIRLAPSFENQKGLITSKNKGHFEWWEAALEIKITGTHNIGADGLAFWYTEQPGKLGDTFGSSKSWKGLGLMLDSFDNDNNGNNPQIIAVLNNNTFEFDHDNDGKGQYVAGCKIDFRNTPQPSTLRIRYLDNVLSVWFKSGLIQPESPFLELPILESGDMDAINFETSFSKVYGHLCFKKEQVYLPKTFGYFGVSAMTGGFGDDHDVVGLTIFSIENTLKVDEKKFHDELIHDEEEVKHMHVNDKGYFEKEKKYMDRLHVEEPYAKDLHLIYSLHNSLVEEISRLQAQITQMEINIKKDIIKDIQILIKQSQNEYMIKSTDVSSQLSNKVSLNLQKLNELQSKIDRLATSFHVKLDKDSGNHYFHFSYIAVILLISVIAVLCLTIIMKKKKKQKLHKYV